MEGRRKDDHLKALVAEILADEALGTKTTRHSCPEQNLTPMSMSRSANFSKRN